MVTCVDSVNHRWKFKKDKRLTITANSFLKIDQHDDSAQGGKIPPSPGTSQNAVFVEFRPLTSWEKNKCFIHQLYIIFVINKKLTFSSRSQGSIQPNRNRSFDKEEKSNSKDAAGKEATNNTK